MDPKATEAVAKVYEGKADELAFLVADTDDLIAHGAYGDCYIGRQLGDKFRLKVEHPETGVIAMVRKMQEILKGMAQAYRDSAREMANTDEEHARNLRK